MEGREKDCSVIRKRHKGGFLLVILVVFAVTLAAVGSSESPESTKDNF